MQIQKLGLAIGIACLLSLSHAADPALAPNAPKDRVVPLVPAEIAPYVQQARNTYAAAKRRFQAGLPAGQSFFLATTLTDLSGNRENVFIAVNRINNGVVYGKIWNDLQTVRGYRYGDAYSFAENRMLDWLITKAYGSEEGNFVGKYLDSRS
ncbi:hypothetical protein IGB42_03057 [Andreprevotia sp. IGB-42]|uniref:DUF2314 domain-containing protein n=1 Tax=Andreprevotia sp. IGB-42 TaxID=2497473 RepID=UPI00135A08DE|nr:DUF2314 domain-containing protein [Andreprevotia sp. IGB-42]KAF0812389.1 hypothetical protein IGB42_03057 [Andreprevotia sp. IGB-42]